MSALGHSRPSHFVPVLNNVRYASDSDHSGYKSELTLWATCRQSAVQKRIHSDHHAGPEVKSRSLPQKRTTKGFNFMGRAVWWQRGRV